MIATLVEWQLPWQRLEFCFLIGYDAGSCHSGRVAIIAQLSMKWGPSPFWASHLCRFEIVLDRGINDTLWSREMWRKKTQMCKQLHLRKHYTLKCANNHICANKTPSMCKASILMWKVQTSHKCGKNCFHQESVSLQNLVYVW